MHMQARMQAWDGGEGKIKNLRKGIAEVEVEFVTPVTHGGSVKFLPAV